MTSPSITIDTSTLFFLQLTIILASCRAVGWLAKCLAQPAVVGEMIAGILLGPSLFGLFLPNWYDAIFPSESMPLLYALSQLGLTLYMFVIGLDFEIEHFRQHSRTAISVSLVGIIAPFILGGLTAVWLSSVGGFYPEKTPLFVAILFMGAAMGITAFPMLARIIVENNLSGTSIGTLSLTAGAINDVAAWCVLTLILSCTSNDWTGPILAIGGGIVYTIVVLKILKPLLRSLTTVAQNRNSIASGLLTLVLGIVMLGAYCTNAIGIHSVFGAFLIGCAMPRGIVCELLKKQIEPLTICLLVPLFFAYTGLKTRLDLVSSVWLVTVAMVVLVTASVGKGVACWAAARWTGEDKGTAMAVGCLMNARGMMGLILLIIGKDNGIIGPELFSILVLMAILTTLATTPTFRWVQARYRVQLD